MSGQSASDIPSGRPSTTTVSERSAPAEVSTSVPAVAIVAVQPWGSLTSYRCVGLDSATWRSAPAGEAAGAADPPGAEHAATRAARAARQTLSRRSFMRAPRIAGAASNAIVGGRWSSRATASAPRQGAGGGGAGGVGGGGGGGGAEPVPARGKAKVPPSPPPPMSTSVSESPSSATLYFEVM